MFSNHYSVELVADMLSTSKSTVNSWIKKKTIKSIKPNGKTFIQKSELKKFDKLSFLFSKIANRCTISFSSSFSSPGL